MAAKNISHAKGGTVLAGFLKLLPFFTLVLPGMAARILFPNQVACSDPEKCMKICGSEKGCSNVAFVFLVLYLMPDGKIPYLVPQWFYSLWRYRCTKLTTA